MPEKPVLVIIGEVHAHVVARMMVAHGMINLALKESGGKKRLVADRSRGYEGTKAAMRQINEGIPKEEMKILRSERIARLFCEEPRTEDRKKAYSDFRKTHDLKRLRARLREDNGRMTRQAVEDAKKIVPELKLWPPVRYALEQYFKKEVQEDVPPLFPFSAVNAACKAGVFDIMPVEGGGQYRKAGAIAELLYLLAHVMGQLGGIYANAPVDEIGKRELLSGLRQEAGRLGRVLNERLLALDTAREREISRNIRENYIPGSALLCGMDHVGPLKRLLSKRFEIRAYGIGKKFIGKDGNMAIG